MKTTPVSFKKEQKKDLIESFTPKAVRVIGLPKQVFVVIINETEPDM